MLINLIDATRISDGALVYIKRVLTSTKELEIALLFSSETLRQNPRNHCVSILDHFQDPEHNEISYMVMPFLHRIDNHPFQLVTQVVEFVDQMLVVSSTL